MLMSQRDMKTREERNFKLIRYIAGRIVGKKLGTFKRAEIVGLASKR